MKDFLNSLIGKTVIEAKGIIMDAGYSCRVWGPLSIGTCECRPDRINICHDQDSDIVTEAYMG